MRKTTKSQKTLKCTVCDGVTAFKVTASGASQVKILEITHDGPVGFWPSLVTASGMAVRSGKIGVTTSERPSHNPNRRRDGVTIWADTV